MPRLGSLLHLVRRGPRLVLGQAASSRPLRVHSCSINLLPARTLSSEPPEHQPESNEPWIPEYIEKFHEPLEDKRSRLMYQSRKRGMLENGLLLGILELTLFLSIHINMLLSHQEVLPRNSCQKWTKRNLFCTTD